MRHLYTFRLIEAVARAGSMRRAAEDMAITASALNRRIRRFEAEFGAELFERLPGGVRLNAAGELRTLPTHLPDADPRFAGIDGFFAARLRRRK